MFSFEYGIEFFLVALAAFLFGWLWWNPPQWLSQRFYGAVQKLAFKVNPSGITLTGIIFSLLGACLIYLRYPVPGLLLLELAYICDFADGLVAKFHKITSEFGKMFDPYADALNCMCVFGSLLLLGIGDPLCFALQMGRDITTNWLRQLQLSFGLSPAARQSGRLKNVLRWLGATICFVLYGVGTPEALEWANLVVIVVTAYSTYSLFDYVWAAYKAGLFVAYRGDQALADYKAQLAAAQTAK